jgi:hypothetical protein
MFLDRKQLKDAASLGMTRMSSQARRNDAVLKTDALLHQSPLERLQTES